MIKVAWLVGAERIAPQILSADPLPIFIQLEKQNLGVLWLLYYQDIDLIGDQNYHLPFSKALVALVGVGGG